MLQAGRKVAAAATGVTVPSGGPVERPRLREAGLAGGRVPAAVLLGAQLPATVPAAAAAVARIKLQATATLAEMVLPVSSSSNGEIMKLAYFNPHDGLILQWMDTEAQNFNLPDASMLHKCTDADWGRQNLDAPQMVKDGTVVDYVKPAVPKSELQAAAWVGIKAERGRRKAGGVKVKVGTTNKWFHSDDASRIQQIGLVMLGAGIPAGLQWKTMDGTFVAMDQTVAGNVFAAAAASDQAIFAVAEGHRVAMEASADPAAYDYSTGWPKVYGE